jgi:hypothetical protein
MELINFKINLKYKLKEFGSFIEEDKVKEI